MNYRVAEWNINRKAQKNKYFYNKIDVMMDEENIDIFFLTEVSIKHKKIIEEELKEQHKYCYKIKKISEIEYIVVLAKKERFNEINFCDDANNESRISNIRIKLITAQNQEFTIDGVRFHTQCNRLEFKRQVSFFIKGILENKTDIIIGDYNWVTTIGKYIDYILGYSKEWNVNKEFSKKILSELLLDKNIELPDKCFKSEFKLCKLINNICTEDNCNYELQPQTECGHYSAKTVNHKGCKLSNPDRVLWNTTKIKVQKNGINYIPKLTDENNEFPEGWISDHSILVFDFSIL